MKSAFLAPIMLASLVSLPLASTVAWADAKSAACIDANSSAQDARAAGQFEKARASLTACMAAACPKRIRDDCTERWEELQRAQPTVILSAKDGSGHDLDAVSVTIDGRPLVTKLDGVAVRVDPGAHNFAFTLASESGAPVSVRVVVKEAERDREVVAVLLRTPNSVADAKGGHEPAEVATSPAQVAPDPLVSSPGSAEAHPTILRTVAVSGGVIGLASIGIGSAFGVLALQSKSTENGHCGSAIGQSSTAACDAQGVAASNALSSRAGLSTGFIVGGAVVTAGPALLYFLAPKSNNVTVGVGPGTLSVSGVF